MPLLRTIFADAGSFVARFNAIDLLVLSINILLILFSRRILRAIYNKPDSDRRFVFRLALFRALNLLIMLSFAYYHLFDSTGSQGAAFKAVAISVLLYLAYWGAHLLHYLIRARFGRARDVDGSKEISDTYNSRLLGLLASIFIVVITLIAVVRILGYGSLLETGGVIGVVGVFFALTQGVWAPDLIGGLIILNSGMVEVGDVIEFSDSGTPIVGLVYKTKAFHTELLNLVNNHRIMLKNASLREHRINNLSKFASAKGLRENLHFKIGYDCSEEAVRAMFNAAFDSAALDRDIKIEAQYPLEVGVFEAGDHAVEWAVYYYTKDVRNLFKTRQRFRETVLKTSKLHNISLATPLTHRAQSPARTPDREQDD